MVTHSALYAEGPGFDSPLGKLFFFFFFFFLRIGYDTVINIKNFDSHIDSESLTGEDVLCLSSMSVCLLMSNASRTRSLGRLSCTCVKHSKYCNAYSRPLEAINLYQMIYSRSLPAIEACRYFY